MIIEILDQIIDSHLDKSNPLSILNKGLTLDAILLSSKMMDLLLIELEEKLPTGTKIQYLKSYRGVVIPVSSTSDLILTYKYETTQS